MTKLVPIEKHSLLSDQQTTALVTPDAQIVWLCLPRIDSPAIFAALLGGNEAGFFAVTPLDTHTQPTQNYKGDTLILSTIWPTLTVTDYLSCEASQRGGKATHTRVELIRHIEGNGLVKVEFAPRLNFGLVATHIVSHGDYLEVLGDDTRIELHAPNVSWTISEQEPHQNAIARVDLDRGALTFRLLFQGNAAKTVPSSLRAATSEADICKQTAVHWQGWVDKLQLPEVEPELVKRSALTLKALCHDPSGAIAAAATTSLPEAIGGVRNWDYRYCWIRDAAMSATALCRLGSTSEAKAFLDWLITVLVREGGSVAALAPLYAVDGLPTPEERTISELCGYANSRPVRVGNAANRQLQLDIFGFVAELIFQMKCAQGSMSTAHWQLLEKLVAEVSASWQRKDQGMWEVRSKPRHHIHSKVMCWLTVDRGVRLSSEFCDHEPKEWLVLRDNIAQYVLSEGWNDKVGAFTTAGDDLDASVLAIGLFGLVNPEDPRFVATVNKIEETLKHHDSVYRYHHQDGVEGSEGAFNLMTSWLIDAKILIGETVEARKLFDALIAQAAPTGLLPEEVDPVTKEGLGNHPQAYSHLGLINNAFNLSQPRKAHQL